MADDFPGIVRTPGVISGGPRIDGTRISPSAVMSFARAGYSVDGIKAQYPTLTDRQIADALAYEVGKRSRRRGPQTNHNTEN